MSDRVRITRFIATDTQWVLPEGATRPDLTVNADGTSSFEFCFKDGEPEYCRYLCPCGCGNQVVLPLVTSRRRRKASEPGHGAVWDVREAGT